VEIRYARLEDHDEIRYDTIRWYHPQIYQTYNFAGDGSHAHAVFEKQFTDLAILVSHAFRLFARTHSHFGLV